MSSIFGAKAESFHVPFLETTGSGQDLERYQNNAVAFGGERLRCAFSRGRRRVTVVIDVSSRDLDLKKLPPGAHFPQELPRGIPDPISRLFHSPGKLFFVPKRAESDPCSDAVRVSFAFFPLPPSSSALNPDSPLRPPSPSTLAGSRPYSIMLLRKGNALILLVTISLTVLVFTFLASTPSSSSSSSRTFSPFHDAPEWDSSSDDMLSGGVHILPIDMGRPNDLGDQGEVTFTNSEDELNNSPPPSSSPPPSQQDLDSSPMSGSPDPRPNLSFPTHPPLRTRLEAFLRRPTLSYDLALEHNVKLCPLEIHDRQVNPDQLNGEREGWKSLTVEEIGRRRRSLVNGLWKVEESGRQVVAGVERGGGGGGRGIVVAGGNQVGSLSYRRAQLRKTRR